MFTERCVVPKVVGVSARGTGDGRGEDGMVRALELRSEDVEELGC